MKTTKKKIEVMTAYERGEAIQAIEHGNPNPNDWVDESVPSWDWVVFDYRIAPIPESKAEQEEKNSEGKFNAKSQEKDSCRFGGELIMKGKLVYALMEDGSTYHGDPHGRASVKIAFDDRIETQLPPTEKPSPSPKTKRVPLTKDAFYGKTIIWCKWDGHEHLVTSWGEYSICFNEQWRTLETLSKINCGYSFDRQTWHPFFVEVADE